MQRASLVAVARNVIDARRALQEALPIELIANTALDILLALYVAQGEGRLLSPAELAGPASPAVTRRWLAAIAATGLIVVADGGVSLTDEGDRRVSAAVRAVILSQIAFPGD